MSKQLRNLILDSNYNWKEENLSGTFTLLRFFILYHCALLFDVHLWRRARHMKNVAKQYFALVRIGKFREMDLSYGTGSSILQNN